MSADIKTCEDLLAYVDDMAENAMTTQQYKTIAEGISKIKKSFDEKQPQYVRVDYIKNEVIWEDDETKLVNSFHSGIFKMFKCETGYFHTNLNRSNGIPSHIVDKFIDVYPPDYNNGFLDYIEEISSTESIVILRIYKL
jgi:hypothetical protein